MDYERKEEYEGLSRVYSCETTESTRVSVLTKRELDTRGLNNMYGG